MGAVDGIDFHIGFGSVAAQSVHDFGQNWEDISMLALSSAHLADQRHVYSAAGIVAMDCQVGETSWSIVGYASESNHSTSWSASGYEFDTGQEH